MKYLISNKSLQQKDLGNIEKLYDVEKASVSSFSVIKQKTGSVYSTTSSTAFVDGYLREFSTRPENVEKQIETGVDFLSHQWPVKDNITGSFSCTIIKEMCKEIILCNDLIGVYPLYYLSNDDTFYVSNSIIWLGIISRAKIDEVGLFQRTFCPEFATIGSRTILDNCKRLLPGEWIRFTSSGEKLEVRYDNTLYQNVFLEDQKIISPEEYWQIFKKEITYCTGESERIHIALSGGMDSRLVLGGISSEKKLTCHTYGAKDHYETKIAERVANLKQAEFRSYSSPELNFPGIKTLKKYAVDTEALFLCSWLEILEAQEKPQRDVLLIGDMTESLQGRNLAVSKTFKTYWKFYVNQKKYPFKENDVTSFKTWKEKIIFIYSRLISASHIKRINLNLSEETLKKAIEKDLEDIFKRIEAHKLPLVELNQELFSWFTHARNPMGKQILQLNSMFRSYCPSMSIQSLRLTSNIPPDRRLNGKFMKSLFSSVEELKPFGKIPTSQIPFVSYNSSDILRVPIWFLRSKIDGFLIGKLMKSKRKEKRYRFLSSYNWVEVYQNPDLEKNLRSYFEKDYVGRIYTEGVVKGALARRDLESWPLTNVNIINAAALNAELGAIYSLRDGDKI